MLGFGTKKPPSLDRFPTENWIVAQAHSGDAPMVLRINSGARKYAGHPELPVRLGVTVTFNSPNEHGFCTNQEGQQISQIEDRITAVLNSQQIGYPVLVVTSGGKREFIFYVRDKERASRAIDTVRAGLTSHPIVYGFEQDPHWAYYRQFS